MRSHRKRTTAKTTRKHRIALNVARCELISTVFICMHTNDDVGVEENRKTFSALNLLVVSCARLVALEISFYAQKKTVRKLLDTIYIHNATWILKIISCFLWKLLKLWIFPFDFHQILSFSNWNWNGTIWIRILWIRIQSIYFFWNNPFGEFSAALSIWHEIPLCNRAHFSELLIQSSVRSVPILRNSFEFNELKHI